jgi:hypothetical protein
LLFSKEKNLLAFPITVMELDEKRNTPENNYPLEYGVFNFQGGYVYNLDPQKGFTLKGRITHLSESDYMKAGNWYAQDGKHVERLLYIGDRLYTISAWGIKAHNLNDLREIGSLRY